MTQPWIWTKGEPNLLEFSVTGTCSNCQTCTARLRMSIEGNHKGESVYIHFCEICYAKQETDPLLSLFRADRKGSSCCVLCGAVALADYSTQTTYEQQQNFIFVKLGCSPYCYRLMQRFLLDASEGDVAVAVCRVCDTETKRTCNRCHVEQYCSKKCQQSDWARHKEFCKPSLNPQTKVFSTPFEAYSAVCEQLNQLDATLLVSSRLLGGNTNKQAHFMLRTNHPQNGSAKKLITSVFPDAKIVFGADPQELYLLLK